MDSKRADGLRDRNRPGLEPSSCMGLFGDGLGDRARAGAGEPAKVARGKVLAGYTVTKWLSKQFVWLCAAYLPRIVFEPARITNVAWRSY